MKAFIWIVLIIIVIIAAVLLLSPRAPQDVEQATIGDVPATEQTGSDQQAALSSAIEITSFSFVGYGPGKSHPGTFERFEVSNVTTKDGLPATGTLTIYTDSVKTDAAMLDTHLKEKKEFFDSATYPTITFTLSGVETRDDNTYLVSGDLTVKNVTKRLSFTVKPNADKTFTSEFRVAMDQFGFAAPGIVDNEVLVQFNGKVN